MRMSDLYSEPLNITFIAPNSHLRIQISEKSLLIYWKVKWVFQYVFPKQGPHSSFHWKECKATADFSSSTTGTLCSVAVSNAPLSSSQVGSLAVRARTSGAQFVLPAVLAPGLPSPRQLLSPSPPPHPHFLPKGTTAHSRLMCNQASLILTAGIRQ